MSNYRRRFLTASEFSSYCTELNLQLSPFDKELELYEKDGVLLPSARIIMPDSYLIERHEQEQKSNCVGFRIPEWDELEKVIYPHNIYELIDDSDLWHSFDLEFDQQNKFLFQPTSGQFKPWDSYYVKVQKDSENGGSKKSVKHYYHYYQVYQIYAIQNRYPVYAKHNLLLENVKDEYKERFSYLTPKPESPRISLEGNLPCFNALSFFSTIYRNEHHRTFDHIPEIDGIKTLNEQQFENYKNQLDAHAKFVLKRFMLTDEDLFRFLLYLIDIHYEYEDKEYTKLANELLLDLHQLVRFIMHASNLTFNDIEIELDKKPLPFWIKQKFRYLDKSLEVYDYTKSTFERLMKKYNEKFPNHKVSLSDIEKLMKFMRQESLFIIPYAIFDIDRTLNESRAFRTTLNYIGLSNLTTGFESYLRNIANIANQFHNTDVFIDKLYSLIRTMFTWGDRQFAPTHGIKKNIHQTDPFSYIRDIYTEPDLDEAVKTFLIVYRARNFIAHNYTIEEDFYHNLYSIVYTAICHAILYSWVNATNQGWVN